MVKKCKCKKKKSSSTDRALLVLVLAGAAVLGSIIGSLFRLLLF